MNTCAQCRFWQDTLPNETPQQREGDWKQCHREQATDSRAQIDNLG